MRTGFHLPEPADGPNGTPPDHGPAECRVCAAPIIRRRHGLWHHTEPER